MSFQVLNVFNILYQLSAANITWHPRICLSGSPYVTAAYLKQSISPIQIEAATFMHFLSTSYTLMTIEQLRAGMPLPVTTEDFLLGIADLTGEVMRYAPVIMRVY
jgi:hypothetical protein